MVMVLFLLPVFTTRAICGSRAKPLSRISEQRMALVEKGRGHVKWQLSLLQHVAFDLPFKNTTSIMFYTVSLLYILQDLSPQFCPMLTPFTVALPTYLLTLLSSRTYAPEVHVLLLLLLALQAPLSPPHTIQALKRGTYWFINVLGPILTPFYCFLREQKSPLEVQ